MARLCTAVLAILAFTGCTVEEKDFPESYGEAYCHRLKVCNRADFDDAYDDIDECVDDSSNVIDDEGDLLEVLGLDYDEETATECVNAIRTSDCDDFGDADYVSDCNNVWS